VPAPIAVTASVGASVASALRHSFSFFAIVIARPIVRARRRSRALGAESQTPSGSQTTTCE